MKLFFQQSKSASINSFRNDELAWLILHSIISITTFAEYSGTHWFQQILQMLCLCLVHQSDCCSGLHMSGFWFLGLVLFRSTNMHPSEGSLSAHRYKVARLLNPGSVDSPQINHVDILLKWSQLYLRSFLDCNLLYSAQQHLPNLALEAHSSTGPCATHSRTVGGLTAGVAIRQKKKKETHRRRRRSLLTAHFELRRDRGILRCVGQTESTWQMLQALMRSQSKRNLLHPSSPKPRTRPRRHLMA